MWYSFTTFIGDFMFKRLWSNRKVDIVLAAIGAIFLTGAFSIYYNNQNSKQLVASIDLFAKEKSSDDGSILQDEDAGFSYAFGTRPTVSESDLSDITYDTEALAPEELTEYESKEAQLYEELRTNPAFSGIDNVYDLLEYDEYDDDGNISIEAIDELLQVAAEAKE